MTNNSIFNRFRQFDLRHKYLAGLIIIAALFFVIYSYYPASQPAKFVSPDATANYHFINLFADDFKLSYQQPGLELGEGIIAPRSTKVVNGQVAPNGFLGLIVIYGLLAKLFTSNILPFITPLLAAVAAVFFYLLLTKIFTPRISFISGLLLLTFPGYWYYASRYLMPNLPFLTCLIIGLFFLLGTFSSRSGKNYILAGLFIGFSLIIRTSEIIWIAPLILLIIVCHRRQQYSWSKLLLLFAIIGFIFLPILLFNYDLYQSPLASGYSSSVDSSLSDSSSPNIGQKIMSLILPFGFSLANAWNNFYSYYLKYMLWFSLPAVLGLLLLIKNWILQKISRAQKGYLLSFIFVTLWLFVFYGSWQFREFSDPDKLILGSSFIRYWLPIFVASLPLASLFLVKVSQLFKSKLGQKYFTIIIILFIFLFSANLVIFDPLYGLAKIKDDVTQYQEISRQVEALTSDDSIIITGGADKVIFPQRQVITSLSNQPLYLLKTLKPLIDQNEVYLYSVTWDRNYLDFRKALSNSNIDQVLIAELAENIVLYKLINQ
ncbi:glycosyltransferase family 39 protein [Patescibacteria group bacterium]|nr:glycosyltransferase family 39 protein [Patescibacteria group bacterium]